MATGRRGAGRVAFLAHLAELKSEIGAGWSFAAVYENHKGKLSGLKYSQFCRYVGRYVTGGVRAAASRPAAPVWAPVQVTGSALSSPAASVPESAAPAAETAGPVDLDAFMNRAVDLDQLARFHKQHHQQRR